MVAGSRASGSTGLVYVAGAAAPVQARSLAGVAFGQASADSGELEAGAQVAPPRGAPASPAIEDDDALWPSLCERLARMSW